MPRIVVDLECLRVLHCGLGQFSLHLGRSLLEEAGDIAWKFLMPPGAASLITGRYEVLTANRWRRERVQRAIRTVFPWAGANACDLWHMTHQDSRYWPQNPQLPLLLTVHDLNFLREKGPAEIRRRLIALQSRVDRAAAVTAISQFAATELQQHIDLRGKPVHVIYNGAWAGREETAARPALLADGGPFLFTIGDITPKKNFHVLLDFIERLPDHRLVIAGNETSLYAQSIAGRIRARRLENRVFLPGKITDDQRCWLYKHCQAFVFPSITEGFGLPVIEAMSLGRPVFLSHATSLPEVAGPLGFYWHSYDPAHMAEVFQKSMRIVESDADFGQKLKQHAAQFTWQRAARGYADLYRRLLADQAQRRAA